MSYSTTAGVVAAESAAIGGRSAASDWNATSVPSAEIVGALDAPAAGTSVAASDNNEIDAVLVTSSRVHRYTWSSAVNTIRVPSADMASSGPVAC